MQSFKMAAAVLMLGGLAGCGQSPAPKAAADASASDCGSGPVSSSLVRTANYEFTASAGPLEATYTPAQVASQHPVSGEMMLAGHMVDVPGMPMGGAPSMHRPPAGIARPGPGPGSYRHIEVHICDRASGMAILQASPHLSLIDRSRHDIAQSIPIAMMQGVHSGIGDIHYGNNAHMDTGHRYMLDVTMMGEHAQFEFNAGR